MNKKSLSKNSKQGKRCFILGNGPSLKQMDLTKLYQEDVFVVNWFVLSKYFENFTKCNYVVCDPHFWNYGEGIHPELITGILKNTKAKYFFDQSARPFIEGSSKFLEGIESFEQVNYLKFSKDNKLWEGSPFITDISKTLSWGYTVIIDFCLPLAFHMGFTEIYLLGCDCDYKLDESKDFKKSFFYDIDKIPENDLRHLRVQRDQRGSQEKHEQWFLSYKVVKEYFEENNRKIYNSGIGGKLEIFDRVNFNSLF